MGVGLSTRTSLMSFVTDLICIANDKHVPIYMIRTRAVMICNDIQNLFYSDGAPVEGQLLPVTNEEPKNLNGKLYEGIGTAGFLSMIYITAGQVPDMPECSE